MTAVVAVVGASGFVGRAVVAALDERGATVRRVPAPRLSTAARSPQTLRAALAEPAARRAAHDLATELAGCRAVVNAAGVAAATGDGDALFGADALLPAVIGEAFPAGRLVHISSAAVQGRREPLDESAAVEPFSPYSRAKALGETALAQRSETVCFRPTSVHGAGRDVTETLVRVLRSPAAWVAGRGTRPTPQVLVGNVADAVAFVTLCSDQPPRVVLQPSEGLTTGELVRRLGGREPRHVPEGAARAALAGLRALGGGSGPVAGMTRRLEMMWFGQRQESGWLSDRWQAPYGLDAWEALR